MSCNCREEIEQKLLERFIKNHQDAKEHRVNLTGYTFILKPEVTMKGYLTAEYEALFLLKNGKNRLKKSHENLIFTYCPFCGKQYDETGGKP